MTQISLWTAENLPASQQIVNVAQVPQRSPLRYPGGKTWLVPHIRTWLRSIPKPKILIEPFAGGGIISLTAAFEDLADHIIMVEMDDGVASLWETILSADSEWLVERILSFDLSFESVREEQAKTPLSRRELGFQTLLRNRTSHGGILAPGSGIIKNGENGRGIQSRWYAQTLAKRIRNIGHIREKISFIHGDGIQVMHQHESSASSAFFLDPPYTAGLNGKRAGKRLYTHNELDHESLFQQAKAVHGSVLMTYDHCKDVVEMAHRYGFPYKIIAMKNTHHATMQEILLGNDLRWVG